MYNTKNHTIWAEKYRPDTFDNYIGNNDLKEKFAKFIEDQSVPHLLMVGTTGTGKTTAAKILIRHIECDSMVLNASDENNIDTVRTKISGFASTIGFSNLKIILLDEFDGFTRQGQEALRNLMEQFSDNSRFILTANYLERISDPIKSRTQFIEVIPPSQKEVAAHVAHILKQENVTYQIADLKRLFDAHYPDIRKIINECQSYSHTGTLVLDKKQIVDADYKLKIIETISTAKSKSSMKQKVEEVRQIFADNRVRDYSDMYRLLYAKVDDYAPNNVAETIITIADGQYKDAFVPDKEINMTATIIQILTILGYK